MMSDRNELECYCDELDLNLTDQEARELGWLTDEEKTHLVCKYITFWVVFAVLILIVFVGLDGIYL